MEPEGFCYRTGVRIGGGRTNQRGTSTLGERKGDVLSSTSSSARVRVPADSTLDNPSYQHYVLVVLVLGYIFNTMDRSVLGILLQPIKEELQISDAALGWLTGPAFAFFYSILGVPIARLADRWSRVNVLAISIAIWTAATALCGAAYNYVSLFIFRCTTGIGEAGGSPPSHSLISDYFAGSKRATALAVYAMAVPFGTAIGSLVSGHSNVSYGWRWTFVMVGAPGLLVALLAWLTIKEPPRGYSDTGKVSQDTPPFLEVFRFLLTRKSFVHMSVAAAAHSVMWYAGSNWNPSFFVRAHGMNTGVAGNYLASFALIGAIGTFAGGFLADRLSVRYGDRRWYMWVPAIACLTMVPFQFFAYLSPQLVRRRAYVHRDGRARLDVLRTVVRDGAVARHGTDAGDVRVGAALHPEHHRADRRPVARRPDQQPSGQQRHLAALRDGDRRRLQHLGRVPLLHGLADLSRRSRGDGAAQRRCGVSVIRRAASRPGTG